VTAAWAATRPGSGLVVPDGLREEIHYRCGRPTWVGKFSPDSTRPEFQEAGNVATLAPHRVLGGDARVNRMTLLVEVAHFGDGNFTLHRCPERVRTCQDCGAPVRFVARQLNRKVQVKKLEAVPDPDGWYVIGADGLAVHDRQCKIPGPRFRPHSCADRAPSRTPTTSLMAKVTTGSLVDPALVGICLPARRVRGSHESRGDRLRTFQGR